MKPSCNEILILRNELLSIGPNNPCAAATIGLPKALIGVAAAVIKGTLKPYYAFDK